MALGDGSRLPLVSRRTPLVDKALKRGSGKHIGRALGKVVGFGLVAEPDDEDMEEKANNLLNGFITGLSDELEIAEEAIDEDSVRELGEFLFGQDAPEYLTEEAKAELGIGDATLEEVMEEVDDATDDDDSSDDSEEAAEEGEEESGSMFAS